LDLARLETHSLPLEIFEFAKIFFGEKVRATNIFYDSGFFSHRKKFTNELG